VKKLIEIAACNMRETATRIAFLRVSKVIKKLTHTHVNNIHQLAYINN